jgi:hypothetical protein
MRSVVVGSMILMSVLLGSKMALGTALRTHRVANAYVLDGDPEYPNAAERVGAKTGSMRDCGVDGHARLASWEVGNSASSSLKDSRWWMDFWRGARAILRF